jgi:predicted nucleotidyltransferase
VKDEACLPAGRDERLTSKDVGHEILYLKAFSKNIAISYLYLVRQLSAILKTLKEIKPALERDYHVNSIGIFGSAVRDDFRPDSDIDILVDFSEPIGITFIDLADFLEKKINAKVDLVSRKGVKPQYLSVIENDIIYV